MAKNGLEYMSCRGPDFLYFFLRTSGTASIWPESALSFDKNGMMQMCVLRVVIDLLYEIRILLQLLLILALEVALRPNSLLAAIFVGHLIVLRIFWNLWIYSMLCLWMLCSSLASSRFRKLLASYSTFLRLWYSREP